MFSQFVRTNKYRSSYSKLVWHCVFFTICLIVLNHLTNVHVCLSDQRSCLFEWSTFMFVWEINVPVCLRDQRSCLFGRSTFMFVWAINVHVCLGNQRSRLFVLCMVTNILHDTFSRLRRYIIFAQQFIFGIPCMMV